MTAVVGEEHVADLGGAGVIQPAAGGGGLVAGDGGAAEHQVAIAVVKNAAAAELSAAGDEAVADGQPGDAHGAADEVKDAVGAAAINDGLGFVGADDVDILGHIQVAALVGIFTGGRQGQGVQAVWDGDGVGAKACRAGVYDGVQVGGLDGLAQ